MISEEIDLKPKKWDNIRRNGKADNIEMKKNPGNPEIMVVTIGLTGSLNKWHQLRYVVHWINSCVPKNIKDIKKKKNKEKTKIETRNKERCKKEKTQKDIVTNEKDSLIKISVSIYESKMRMMMMIIVVMRTVIIIIIIMIIVIMTRIMMVIIMNIIIIKQIGLILINMKNKLYLVMKMVLILQNMIMTVMLIIPQIKDDDYNVIFHRSWDETCDKKKIH